MERGLAVGALLWLFAGTLTAQWVDVRTPGIPRLVDGRPDLTAPPPRHPGGGPDLSGLWMLEATMDFGFMGLAMGPEWRDIGASLEGGLPYLPWAAEQVATHRAEMRVKDPLSHCLPIGPVRLHTTTSYRQLIHLPEMLVILSEHDSKFRRIFLDGRPLPDDPIPKLNGYSSGRWEGDTLVVETTGFLDGSIWLDAYGSPLTDAGKLTERFRRVNAGQLQIELTVDDPNAYTQPWTVTLTQRLVPDAELDEAFCAEEQLRLHLEAALD